MGLREDIEGRPRCHDGHDDQHSAQQGVRREEEAVVRLGPMKSQEPHWRDPDSDDDLHGSWSFPSWKRSKDVSHKSTRC
eukprot:scaffold7362_cov266-Pinguiococcus_pyrenoidosus.AAC.3